MMRCADLSRLDTWDAESGSLNVIIETVKGRRNKFTYEPKRALFRLSNVLAYGTVFPFDFGFLPSTRGEDGNPLDILVLMDEPTFPGCLIACRLLGVIEAEQTEDGETVRNDRLIAVAEHCQAQQTVRSLRQLDPQLLKDIEHFFISYNEMAGKQFRPIGNRGPKRAKKLVQKGVQRSSGEGRSEAQGQRDGQPMRSKQK